MEVKKTTQNIDSNNYMSQPWHQRLLNYAGYSEIHGYLSTITNKVYENDPSKDIKAMFSTFHKYQKNKIFVSEKEEIQGYFERLYLNGHINVRVKTLLSNAFTHILGEEETFHPAYKLNQVYNELNIQSSYDLALKFAENYKTIQKNNLLQNSVDFILSTTTPNMRNVEKMEVDSLKLKLKEA